MPRTRRPFLPNVGFHITARTQGGERLFDPEIRTRIFDDILQASETFGHTLLAHVVMPNHFHIILKHGPTPLGWAMQRIMQRAVNHVRSKNPAGEGHVFGRPYWSCACSNPGYLRRAIVYTHMNPVKAGLCNNPDDYAWSSHNSFVRVSNAEGASRDEALNGLMLFANRDVELSKVVASYNTFIDYCVERRRLAVPGDWLLPEGPNRVLIPPAQHGDGHWAATYSKFVEPTSFTQTNVDVTSRAKLNLKRIDPKVDLELIQTAGRSKKLSVLRRQLIETLLIDGCRPGAIARCLRVSPSLVSRVGCAMRYSARMVA